MSGPYDSYGGPQYNQQQGSNQYPPQGYSSGYNYNQQGYPPQPQQQYYDQGQNFGPPQRADSFGPPSHGGFQHGQAGGMYGTYDASNPQGHAGYYGQPQQYNSAGSDAFAQNQAYQASMSGGTHSPQPGYDQQRNQWNQGVENHQFQSQSSDPNAPNYDPKAPPMTEGERGLLGALGGGVGGHFVGKKAGHGLIGTIGGAILGSMAEDFAKDKHRKHKHHSHHGSQSSWGGGRY